MWPAIVRHLREPSIWLVVLIWVSLAVVLAMVTDEISAPLISGLAPQMSSSSAIALLTAIASGMIAFTGFVFSVALVVQQFGSTAYSPRLVRALERRGRLVGHALGVFCGTFVYALLAIRTVDVEGSGDVNTSVISVAMLWLGASLVLFIAMIPQVRLSITHVLLFLHDAGQDAIKKTYRPAFAVDERTFANELPPASRVLRHVGPPMNVQRLDIEELVDTAREADAIIVVPRAIGDLVTRDTPLVVVHGGSRAIGEERVRSAVVLGPDRALDCDPAYALRLLVDIAIRALSPAVNDPSTAIQALDRIQALLVELGRCHLETQHVVDRDDQLRLVYVQPTWDDLLLSSLCEIQQYGRDSVQVERRLGALLYDLHEAVPEERRAAVERWIDRRNEALSETFRSTALIPEAAASDRQGLGHTIQKTIASEP